MRKFLTATSTYFMRGKQLPENPVVPKTMGLNHESVRESKLDHQCKSPNNYNVQSIINENHLITINHIPVYTNIYESLEEVL